jgi:hypothetical protein
MTETDGLFFENGIYYHKKCYRIVQTDKWFEQYREALDKRFEQYREALEYQSRHVIGDMRFPGDQMNYCNAMGDNDFKCTDCSGWEESDNKACFHLKFGKYCTR